MRASTASSSPLRFACGSGLLRCPTSPPGPLRPWFARYHLLGQAAQGGVGTIHAGRDTTTGKRVAIKLLQPEHADSAEVVSRFLGELEVGLRVDHPGLVKIHDGGFTPEGDAAIVMDWVEGASLAHAVGAPLPTDDIRAHGAQIASAIAALHEAQVVHCDLKPENVIVGPRGPGRPAGKATVVDFGVARFLDEPGELEPTIAGTPPYMAPEQWRGRIGTATDVYALGCLLYELVTGDVPFDGSSVVDLMCAHLERPVVPPTARAPGADVGLERLILAMLAKTPAARPSMAAVAATLSW